MHLARTGSFNIKMKFSLALTDEGGIIILRLKG